MTSDQPPASSQGDGGLPTSMTRARFLKLATGTTLGLWGLGVAGCGGKSSSTTRTATVPISSIPIAPSTGQIGGTLNYFGWQGYDLLSAMKPWDAAHHVTVNSAYMTNYPDIPPKLHGGGHIDVTNGDSGYDALFEYTGVLTRFTNRHLVPNLSNVSPRFLAKFTLPDGSLLGTPFSWGTFSIVYNPQTAKVAPRRWTDLLLPEFKGRITFLDDPIVSFSVAALHRGQDDFSHQTPAELQESVSYMKKFKAQAKTIAPTYGDIINLFQGREIDAAFGPGGWSALVLFVGRGVKLTHVFPEDRSITYLTSYYVPLEATNGATAFAWINQTLTPQVQKGITAALGEGIVCTKFANLLAPAERSLYPYANLDAHLAANPFFLLPPLTPNGKWTTREDWYTAWAEVKA